jgi:hypothetical protein
LQQFRKKIMVKNIVRKYTDSMEALMNCAAACENCVSVCINDGKPLSCCHICLDCADICMTLFRLEAHNSTFLKAMYKICADICDACANECEKHADYHPHCKASMYASRDCAEMCRALSQ